jgi:16S rRNA (cytosine1402-N4)-methyltransferase
VIWRKRNAERKMRNNRSEEIHKPVLVKEVIKYLHIKNQARYIDATVGLGGHTLEILKRGGVVLGIDFDPEILSHAKKRLEAFCRSDACPTPNHIRGQSFKLVQGNFREIDQIAEEYGFLSVAGVIIDLGISSFHLKRHVRGFSFKDESSYLDMRLNPNTQGVKASDLLNGLRKDQLIKLFEVVLGKNAVKSLVNEILIAREKKPFKKVGDLLEVVDLAGLRTKGRRYKRHKKNIHPATNVFLALRIAVNNELDSIQVALPKAIKLLGRGGRLLVISFHSGEDRIVKRFNKKKQDTREAKIVTKKPVKPSNAEVDRNPSSRSAKMRVLEKK